MTPKFAFIAAGAVIAGLLGGTYYWTQQRTLEACLPGGTVAGDIGGPFTLVSETGETVTDADVITGPTLVYFGYTFCPDVCPLDTARNAEAVELLAEKGHEVKPVFITVDPKRDTPEELTFFTDALHPEMLGLTGSEAQVRAAMRAYRAYGQAQDGDDAYYLVDHSTFSYLMFPEIGFADFYRRDLTPEDLAERIACVIDTV
ncbi:MAG: SCO family protein [Paracoccaceae bacterium]|nr:SCO family protein [Paracoccaceae bacterium]